MKIRRSLKWRRSKRELSVQALGLIVFLVVVYFLAQQNTP